MGRVVGLTDVFFERTVWPLWARRDDPRYPQFAREIGRRQYDSLSVIRARQNTSVQRIIRHAQQSVSYYRDLFRDHGIDAANVRSADDLRVVPILDKAIIREQNEKLRSNAVPSFVIKKTSGSTGVPLRVGLDHRGLAWKRACTLLADESSGWRRGRRVAKAWGNPEHVQYGLKGWLRNALFERAIHLDTLRMTEADILAFVDRLYRWKPSLLFGHAHSIYLLAQFIHNRGLTPIRPDGIITTAMILHAHERKLIERVFSCRVTNRYGCEEVSLIACECSAHGGLHVNEDSVFVELLTDGRPSKPGEAGQVVITDLSNYAMPLIRYRVGDVARWADAKCPCGRAGAVLMNVEGRDADYVVTARGEFVSGISLTENFATLVPGIAQIQIVQESIISFLFRIVQGPEFSSKSIDRIAELVRERFGDETAFRCEYVSAIPQEPSGKYRFCISHVAAARAAA